MTNKFEQLIELFIAEDEAAAKDLFHEIVVEKSRDIYESLTDEDQVEETAEVDEDAVEEAEEIEESDFDEAELGGDAADDMIDDIEADEEGLSMEDDDAEEEIEDRVVDLEDALDELKAEFEALMGGDDAADDDAMDMEPEMDMDMGDEEGEEEEGEEEEADESFVREYTEKAPAPVTSEEGDGSAGPVAGKNDMGGKAVDPTGEEKGSATPKSTVQTDASDTRGATMSKA
jgi:exosome complex component RRP41